MSRRARHIPPTALLLIDVQARFCDPRKGLGTAETERTAQRIATLVPEFRKAGLAICAIHYTSESPSTDRPVDFHRFRPEGSDIIIPKYQKSAFTSGPTRRILEGGQHKHLLVCGFNLNSCVRLSVLDARYYGFRVTLLEDLTGNNRNNTDLAAPVLYDLKKSGARLSTAAEELARLKPKQA